jgi:hypothetical protein
MVVGEDSKGYALLAKMGYKGGGPAPLELRMKTGRGGLGVEEDARRAAAKRAKAEEAAAVANVREQRVRVVPVIM